jgi:hypothetical protein
MNMIIDSPLFLSLLFGQFIFVVSFVIVMLLLNYFEFEWPRHAEHKDIVDIENALRHAPQQHQKTSKPKPAPKAEKREFVLPHRAFRSQHLTENSLFT